MTFRLYLVLATLLMISLGSGCAEETPPVAATPVPVAPGDTAGIPKNVNAKGAAREVAVPSSPAP